MGFQHVFWKSADLKKRKGQLKSELILSKPKKVQHLWASGSLKTGWRALEGSRKKIEKLSDIFEHLENNIPKKCLTDSMEQISETYMIRKNES